MYGTSVSFFLSSINDIATGDEYLNFTRLVAFNDGTAPGGANWRLRVYSNDATIQSLTGATLPLSVIEVQATCTDVVPTTLGYQLLIQDTAPGYSGALLLDGGATTTPPVPGTGMVIDISYRLAPLTGYQSGYYMVNLNFVMEFY